MKKIKLKRSLSLVLSGFMSVSLLGVANLKINAEASSDPSINKFATADQLLDESIFNLREVGKTKNVYGGKGTKAQKVYFGKDADGQSQKWYIAGSEDDGLVLFSDPKQPLLTNQIFGDNNKYSSSELKQVLEDLTSGPSTMFTKAEQNIMVETTYSISNDRERSDKLYLARGYYGGYEIRVGSNVGSNDSIKINLGAITGSDWFWLCNPNSTYGGNNVLVAKPGGRTSFISPSNTDQNVVSALKIDLTSLIFASSASAVSSSNQFPEENVMTFRYQDTEGKIKSKAEWDPSWILVEKSDEDAGNIYLYVQGKNGNQDWVYSTQITKNTVLLLENINSNADLSQCKIWLETFDENDNMVYAKFADKLIYSNEDSEEDSKEQINLGISENIALNGESVNNNASGGGFVTSSVDPMAISQPMVSKSLKESVKFGQNIAKTDSGETIQVDVSNIENSALTTEQKDIFKDKDAICLDLTSSGKYDKVETIKYKLGKDLANREFEVYYIYEGKIQLLTESFKLDNEGNIKIISSYGASYILIEK